MVGFKERIIAKERMYRITQPDYVTRGKLNRNSDYILSAIPNSIYVDWSAMLSKLIQLAGLHCESFASDLFMFWNEFVRQFNASDWKSLTHTIFGFYENGVDCNSEVVDRVAADSHYYRCVAAVDVNVSEDGEVVMSMQVF